MGLIDPTANLENHVNNLRREDLESMKNNGFNPLNASNSLHFQDTGLPNPPIARLNTLLITPFNQFISHHSSVGSRFRAPPVPQSSHLGPPKTSFGQTATLRNVAVYGAINRNVVQDPIHSTRLHVGETNIASVIIKTQRFMKHQSITRNTNPSTADQPRP